MGDAEAPGDLLELVVHLFVLGGDSLSEFRDVKSEAAFFFARFPISTSAKQLTAASYELFVGSTNSC
jgi:hypothetical protein